MLLNHLLRGQHTLFARKNHQALEPVVPLLNGAIEGGDLIINTASRDLAQRQSYLVKLQNLLARPPRLDTALGEAFQQRFCEVFTRQREALADVQALERTREEYGTLNQDPDALRKHLPLHAQSDTALANWPGEFTCGRLEAMETELCAAFLLPSNVFQRL